MKNVNQNMLDHAFKATKPEQIKKILKINYGFEGPVLFALLSRPNYFEKTLALGNVVNECLIELAHNGKNIFNFLLTYKTLNHWSSFKNTEDQNTLKCYFLLFNHLRKNDPQLFESLLNIPDNYGYIPLSKMISHYRELTKTTKREHIEENVLNLVNLTNLNYCDKSGQHLLKNYVYTMSNLFKYNKLETYSYQFLINFLDILIDSGLNLNLSLPDKSSIALDAFKQANSDVMNLFLPHFDKIDFSVVNNSGESFTQILECKEDKIKIHFEKFLLNKTIANQNNKKSLKI